MSDDIVKVPSHELAAETSVFMTVLQRYGLPTDNILASTEERSVVASNLPKFLDALPAEVKQDARYLSKFVAGTAIGLFDAALNYVWNEVVLTLRKKTVMYGLDLFFDAAVGGKTRDLYKSEADLQGLKDQTLLDTCRKLELISDVVFKKLHHILTMRNDVAASHPNVEQIGGFELLGWLQTCVKDVLQDQPSASAIQIKALVDNLRQLQTPIDKTMLAQMSASLRQLAPAHANNLLLTLFGIYTTIGTDATLKKNAAVLAPAVWQFAQDTAKTSIGITLDGFTTNLHNDRHLAGIEFLKLVDGLKYQTVSAKIIQIDDLCDRLLAARYAWDNFYHEPPIMGEILRYMKVIADVPPEKLQKLIKVVLICRLGKGISYSKGVSPGGLPLYNHFISLLDDGAAAILIATLFEHDVSSLLEYEICREHLVAVLTLVKSRVTHQRLSQAIDFLLRDPATAGKANAVASFRELTKHHIAWQ